MATKKEIIIKWIRHTPLLRLDECVDNAMEEYAKQECAAKEEEIERLKGLIEKSHESGYMDYETRSLTLSWNIFKSKNNL